MVSSYYSPMTYTVSLLYPHLDDISFEQNEQTVTIVRPTHPPSSHQTHGWARARAALGQVATLELSLPPTLSQVLPIIVLRQSLKGHLLYNLCSIVGT